MLICTGLLHAQIDNLTNLSPEWIRTGARNASTDGTDILAYNPAGMAFLKSGFHVNIGNQSFLRKPSHEFDLGYGMGVEKYEQDGNDLFVPNLYLSYNKDKWAVFGGAYIAGGGATADFPKGSFTTDLIGLSVLQGAAASGADYSFTQNAYIKASSYYISYALGGAYKITDKISFGVFARYFSAMNEIETGLTLTGSAMGLPDQPLAFKSKEDASGIGIVGGFHFRATEKFDIAVRYESQVGLEFKTSIDKDEIGLATDGEKNNRDFPAVAGLGLSYKLKDNFKILFDFNYYFQKNADWGLIDDTVTFGKINLAEFAGDASTYGIAFEYAINNNWMVSLGSVYSLFSYKNEPAYFTHAGAYETVSDNNVTLNLGLAYNINEKIRINAGFLHAFYSKDKKVDSPYGFSIIVNNSISSFGLGVDLTF